MSYIMLSAVCHSGKIREENQDTVYIQGINENRNTNSINISRTIKLEDTQKMAVFDGMGGEERGEIASKIAKDVFSENSNSELSLEDICLLINDEICGYMETNDIFRMGSTAAMVSVNDTVQFCNIGDSKIYKISDSSIEQLSEDHITIIGKYNKRKVLNQHLGIPEKEMIIEPYSGETEYDQNDVFIICSDGLTDMLDEDTILAISTKSKIENLAGVLFNEAMNRGGKDNISIIAFKIMG